MLKPINQFLSTDKTTLPIEYKNHPLIADLNLTDKEFKQHFGAIMHMIQQYSNALTDNPNNEVRFQTKLIRDQNNKLQLISFVTPETNFLYRIRSHYSLRDFPDRNLNILLDKKSIGSLVDSNKKKILNHYLSVLKEPLKSHGAYVYGDVGVGKTFTAIALANELANRELDVAFINCADIGYKLKQGFSDENHSNDIVVSKMRNADVLFLDDIGAEDEKIWFYNNYLMIVLNYRMDHNKLTFFTSNLSIDYLNKKLSILMHGSFNAQRFIERIRALVKNQQFRITGPSRRY
ncbi:MAG: ATP-binding protein [Mycoplasmataceae bacterium]|nr:ATP-binding protein [Mycoplasmataceae bacterium]